MDSLMGDLPNKFDKNNNDNDDANLTSLPFDSPDDGIMKKDDDSARQKEKDLARAYGGKPPKAKKKKINKKRRNEADDKLATDRMYPFLQ